MQNNETMTLFAFDMNSLFARVFTRMAPKNVMPKWNGAYLDDGTPVFCLRAVHNMVFNEIAAMRKLGVENTHIVLVFDHPGKNFRHEIFPQYKGSLHRQDGQYPRYAANRHAAFRRFVQAGSGIL